MKNIIKLTTMSFLLLCAAIAANAQTPYNTTGNSDANAGSVGVSVTVPKSADLRSSSNASGADGGATLTGVSNNNALDVSLNFTDVSPNNTSVNGTSAGSSRFLRARIPIRIRSNAAYQIKAFMEGTGANAIPGGAGNSGDFKTGDIGFGLNDTSSPSGSSLLFSGGSINVSSPFNNAPENTTVTNGQPAYSSTLNNIGQGSANATTVASGSRISTRGDNSSDNWRSVRMRFAVKPQYYTPGTFSDTFKIFVVTP